MTSPTHRLLVAGAGSIGERHIRCYLATGRVTVGVCETNAERCRSVADTYQLSSAYTDFESALQDSWDAVLIATPAHTHIPLALQAVEAGSSVLIEKPLSTSLDGIDRLKQLLEEKQATCIVSYQLRAHPAARSMKEALDSGRFGKPLQVYHISGQNFAYWRPAYPDTYFTDRKTGGGAIQDAITHSWNLVEWFVGPITRMCVDAVHQQLPQVSVEDTVHVLARHNGIPASYSLNMYQHPNESLITIVCERGTLRLDLHKHCWSSCTTPASEWDVQHFPLEDRDAWYIENASICLDALEGRRAPLCSLDDACQTLQVNLAALRSADTLTWQDVGESAE